MMNRIKNINYLEIFRRWWMSVILIPFIVYHLHQAYWTLRFNIFFSYSYDFPFPVNAVNFMVQNFLLIVHEAGHTFMGFLGNRTLTILGGSFYEILLPLIILAYLLFNKFIKGSQLGFYLAGSAWLSVAFYAADASGRQLPLIGNLGDSAHDWGNLLTNWGLLQYDTTIGIVFALTGAACYAAALSVPFWMQTYEEADIELDL
jgi:hypothetical protein